jgi:uncharacterized protein (TIGR02145 family)
MYYRFFAIMIFAISFLFSCGDDNSTNPVENKSDTVKIGTQIWKKKNLDVDQYRNGDPIPQVTNFAEWKNLRTGAWCYYNNDPAMGPIYGKLYNWYAVNDPRGLAPSGWHIPSEEEWQTLEIQLGISQDQLDKIGSRGIDEGGKMKETGLAHWLSPNKGATNLSGFSALPGGWRGSQEVKFYDIGFNGNWWTSTEIDTTIALNRGLYASNSHIVRGSSTFEYGLSVRCIKDK